MSRRLALLLVFWLLAPRPARAQLELDPDDPSEAAEEYWYTPPTGPKSEGFAQKIMDFFVSQQDRSMLIRLPEVDTDPNRGATLGVMPVWVLQDEAKSRITSIHALFLDYNKIFGTSTAYQLYYYPSMKSQLQVYGLWSQRVNREATVEWFDNDAWGRGIHAAARFSWLRDGSKRFFGFGARSEFANQTDYTQDTLAYRLKLGLPLEKNNRLRLSLLHSLRWDKNLPGAIDSLPDLNERFPKLANFKFEPLAQFGAELADDTRDSANTTTEGHYAQLYAHLYPSAFSRYAGFTDWGAEYRQFWHPDPDSPWVAAFQGHFNVEDGGDIPFYAQSRLGGKYSLRGFGAGRFTDKGMVFANLELRRRVWRTVVQDVPAELWVDPFFGSGTVFSTPDSLKSKELQESYGVALRMLARPQVVGSLDLGWSKEGMAVFMDVNYSF